ncbi:MAG: N-6 DNA methylase, partial [Candidatus Nanopelagicales bacterium]
SARIADGQLRLEDYHRSLLRLVYRLLFLFVAEDRGLLQDPAADQVAVYRYRDYFSTGRLRALARKRRGARHTDLWQGLQLVISGLGDERGLPELGLPGLGGIFNHEPIDVVIGQRLPNEALLTAIRRLSVVQPKNSPPRIVDYRNLGAEELGSIYESLLELVPRHDHLGRTFTLENLAGNDRKTSGSYYTPTSLIDLVLDQALDPLLDEAEKVKDPEQALLAMTICDPACGSGHFLVAAARRIASRLATVRTGELDPTPSDVHEALHDVVARCIYGIDLNPMAAELAKVSLWLEAMQEGRPLSFLDAHIKVGNALLGVTPRLLEEGLPDTAFVALTGDDKAWTSSLKKRNKAEREQADQGELFTTGGLHAGNTDLATKVAKVDTGAAPSLADAHQQAQRFRDLQKDPDYARARQVADAWCAAFVQPKRQGDPAITHSTLQALQDDPGSVDPAIIAIIEREAIDYRFFHWHLEFPQVFRVDHGAEADPASGWSGGFTAMLGNPPW